MVRGKKYDGGRSPDDTTNHITTRGLNAMKRLIPRKAYYVCLAAALLLSLAVVSPASANTVSYNVSFSAKSFQSYASGTAPVDPVTGSFTITFDPTQTYINDTSHITLNSLNISLGSALSFDYSPTTLTDVNDGGPSLVTLNAHELSVGGTYDGPQIIQYGPATNDFWLFINDFDTSPTFNQLGYAQTTADYNYFYTINNTGSVTATPTPLPGSLLLLGAGLVRLTAFSRRRKLTSSS